MKIKEVENRVGMTRANIRYYEKEGLLGTTIRNENNYREYTEENQDLTSSWNRTCRHQTFKCKRSFNGSVDAEKNPGTGKSSERNSGCS